MNGARSRLVENAEKFLQPLKNLVQQVCVYLYMYVCMYVRMCICMYVCMYIRMCVYIYV